MGFCLLVIVRGVVSGCKGFLWLCLNWQGLICWLIHWHQGVTLFSKFVSHSQKTTTFESTSMLISKPITLCIQEMHTYYAPFDMTSHKQAFKKCLFHKTTYIVRGNHLSCRLDIKLNNKLTNRKPHHSPHRNLTHIFVKTNPLQYLSLSANFMWNFIMCHVYLAKHYVQCQAIKSCKHIREVKAI